MSLRDLKAKAERKRREWIAADKAVDAARDSAPIPAGVYVRRKSTSIPALYCVIDVFVDGKRIGVIEDLSNAYGTQYRPKVFGRTVQTTPSLNAAVWLLL